MIVHIGFVVVGIGMTPSRLDPIMSIRWNLAVLIQYVPQAPTTWTIELFTPGGTSNDTLVTLSLFQVSVLEALQLYPVFCPTRVSNWNLCERTLASSPSENPIFSSNEFSWKLPEFGAVWSAE